MNKTTEQLRKDFILEWIYQPTGSKKVNDFQLSNILSRVSRSIGGINKIINSVKKEKVCKWIEDVDYGSTYNTECGEMWSFTEDGVTKNKVRYCFYCGGKVEVIKTIRKD